MTCFPIVSGDTRVGFVCCSDGETKPVPRARKRRLWCFGCRKRVLHIRMAHYPKPFSYYGPEFWWECPTCKEDRTTFPGCDYD